MAKKSPLAKTFLAAGAAAFLSVSALAPAALAQADGIRMPTPRKAEDPPILWAYLMVIVVLGAVFGANMIPSKRGHQD